MSSLTPETALVPVVGDVGARVVAALTAGTTQALAVSSTFFDQPMIRDHLEVLAPRTDKGLLPDAAPAVLEITDERSRLVITADPVDALSKASSVDLLLLDLVDAGARPTTRAYIEALFEQLPPGATVIVAVVSGWLASHQWASERKVMLELAALKTVVDVGRPGLAQRDRNLSKKWGSGHGPPVALLHLVRAGEPVPTYFVTVPHASNASAPAVERFIAALAAVPLRETRTEWGFTKLVGAERWDADWLRPERQELIAELANKDEVVLLGEIATVRRGRRPPRDVHDGPEVSLVQIRELAEGLPAAENLPSFPTGGRLDRLVKVEPGDILVSVLGDQRWAIVPDSYADVYAGDHIATIRLDPEIPMSPEYLLAWLSSTAARPLFASRGAAVPRLDVRDLEQVAVPTVDGTVTASQQIARTDDAIRLLATRLEDLTAAKAGLFDGLRSDQIRRRIAEVADSAATTMASLERHGDLLRRVQDLYPYPIARNVRALRLAQHPRAKYDEILNSFESLLQYLTLLSLAWARTSMLETPQMAEWRTKVYQGGASLGTLLSVAQSISKAAVEADADVSFAPALAAGGKGSLGSTLGELISERNSVHGNRPQSDAAYELRVDETLPKIELALEASSFLVRDDLLWVTNVRPVDRPGGPVFEITAERAMGDHPDWDVVAAVVPKVVFEERFYLWSNEDDRFVDLSPYLLALRCSECHQRHLYCPDKVKPAAVVFSSLDRGHQREDRDETLRGRIVTAIPKPSA